MLQFIKPFKATYMLNKKFIFQDISNHKQAHIKPQRKREVPVTCGNIFERCDCFREMFLNVVTA